MKIKLYHATSSAIYEKIQEVGFLKPSYLTIDEDQAEYYAECASEEDESEPVILVVSVDPNYLKADLPSFDEPLSYILKDHGMSEHDWHEAINHGTLSYPDIDDYKTSLKITKTAKCCVSIPLIDIEYAGSLNEEDIKLIFKTSNTLKM